MTAAALIGGTGDRTKPPAVFNDVLSRVAENSPYSPLADTHGKKDAKSVANRNIVKKARKKLGGKITAAAVTGPAKHPLPASSVPASTFDVICLINKT